LTMQTELASLVDNAIYKRWTSDEFPSMMPTQHTHGLQPDARFCVRLRNNPGPKAKLCD